VTGAGPVLQASRDSAFPPFDRDEPPGYGHLSRRAVPRWLVIDRLQPGHSPHMAPIIPDPKKIKGFRTQEAFEAWLAANHARETELWLKIHKKGSGVPTVTYAQALDVALCWGWIDGIKKTFDEGAFLQRFTPRGAKSVWSQINRDHVARLTAAGRMTPHGQRHVDAARADGRWEAAYAPIRSATEATIPEDLRAAIEASPRALETLRTLTRQNLFALAFRVSNMRTPAGRVKKIAALVAMLARGETIVPQGQR
jgi:uncharacterized protein YdeI (YjbR/CyaY-like superfamily)